MRKFLLPFFMLATVHVVAQADSSIATVRYSFTHIQDTTQPDNPLKMNMVLYIGQQMSRYTIDRTPLTPSKGSASTVAISDVAVGSISAINVTPSGVTVTSGGVTSQVAMPKEFYYNNSYVKDMNNSKLSFLTMPPSSGKLFSVEEALPVIDWTITTDTKEIAGMVCQKATCRFKGRNYEAWFNSQLPYSNGPWKLGGLPGLIIEAYDTKQEVMFKMTAFESGSTVAIDIPATVVRTTPKEYKQYQEALQRDREAGKANMSSSGMMVVTGRPMIADGKPVKIRGNNNPIEKE